MESVTTIEWVVFGASLVCVAVASWFIRHSVLRRQLTQTKAKLKTLESEYQLEHAELAILRPKMIQKESLQSDLKKYKNEAKDLKKEHETFMADYDKLKTEVIEIRKDRDEILEQLGFLEAEKSSWQQNEVKLLDAKESQTQELKTLAYKLEEYKALAARAESERDSSRKTKITTETHSRPQDRSRKERAIAKRMMREQAESRHKVDAPHGDGIVTDKFGKRAASTGSLPLAETPITRMPARKAPSRPPVQTPSKPVVQPEPKPEAPPESKPVEKPRPLIQIPPKRKSEKSQQGKIKSTGIRLLEAMEEELKFPKRNS